MLSFTAKKRIRNQFGNIKDIAEMPNLIELQKNSYDKLLGGGDIDASGLVDVFKSVFPINDFAETSTLGVCYI